MADGTTTAEFTFFNKAGRKVTGHDCEDVLRSFKPTPERQIPSEITNIVGKRHIFQIQFATNSQKGAGRFTVNDILDIPKPTTAQNNTGATTSVDGVRNQEAEAANMLEKGASMPLTRAVNEPVARERSSFTALALPLTQETNEENETACTLDTPDVQDTPTDTKDQTNVVSGTPPHDVVETIAATIVSTIPNQKVAPEKAKATSKRSLNRVLLSEETKKKKAE